MRTHLQIAFLVLTATSGVAAEPTIHLGDQRELFIDRRLIDSLSGGAVLQLQRPQPAGAALVFDRPWEGIYCAYATVIQDGEKYRMYYRGNPGEEKDGSAVEVTCYAESGDGIHWTKPDLGLFEVMGTRKNNVVLAHDPPFSHNFSPFLDTRPDVPPAERYKAVAGLAPGGLIFYGSADGLRWSKLAGKSFNETGWVFDSQNVVFWSESEQTYVLYYRRVVNGVRSVARSSSPDLAQWSPPVLMQAAADPPVAHEQLYTNQTHPYFRAPQISVALAARFMEGRATLSEQQQAELGLAEASWLTLDCSDAVLLTTRGGNRYDRTFPEAFIRPGLDPRNWVSRANYPALGVVPTGAGEMSIYVQRHYGQPTHFLERLTLRTDGFASIAASAAGGELHTRVLTFHGRALQINYATSAAGSVRIELQDATGRPIPGFTADDALPVTGDAIDQVVSWKAGGSLEALAGKPVRLRVLLVDANLYAIRFVP